MEETGALVAITRADEAWNVAPLATRPVLPEKYALHAADLDNNGAVDLVMLPVALNAGDFPRRLCLVKQRSAENSSCCPRRLVPHASLTLPTQCRWKA